MPSCLPYFHGAPYGFLATVYTVTNTTNVQKFNVHFRIYMKQKRKCNFLQTQKKQCNMQQLGFYVPRW